MSDVLPICGLIVGGVSPDMLVCGDPARAERISARLDGAHLLTDRREYRAFLGTYRGLSITVCSHGVGAPGAAIAFEELIAAGGRNIIRVGTCGSLQPDIDSGDLVIAAAAVQNTGYGREVAPPGYPAAADPALTLALERATAGAGRAARRGIVLSRDAFYPGAQVATAPDYQALSQARVLAVEMECAALFLVGGLRGVATAAVLAVDGNVLHAPESMDTYRPSREVVQSAVEAAIDIALDALWTHAQTN